MARRAFLPPIEAVDGADGTTRWEIRLDDEQRAAVVHLFGELRSLLRDGDPDRPPLLRLFPPVYLDDEEKESEYRRLMRDELVTSRLAQLEAAEAFLAPGGPDDLDEAAVISLLQALNAVRVVLGTILDVGDDDGDDLDDGLDDSPEHQLYGFLSWLLEWTVRSLSG